MRLYITNRIVPYIIPASSTGRSRLTEENKQFLVSQGYTLVPDHEYSQCPRATRCRRKFDKV